MTGETPASVDSVLDRLTGRAPRTVTVRFWLSDEARVEGQRLRQEWASLVVDHASSGDETTKDQDRVAAAKQACDDHLTENTWVWTVRTVPPYVRKDIETLAVPSREQVAEHKQRYGDDSVLVVDERRFETLMLAEATVEIRFPGEPPVTELSEHDVDRLLRSPGFSDGDHKALLAASVQVQNVSSVAGTAGKG